MNIAQLKNLEGTVEEINSLIDVLITITSEDFSQAIKLLRDSAAQGKMDLQPVSMIVGQMQCFDLLCQRMDHIKIIHSWVIKLLYTSDAHSKEKSSETSLLRLNQLQFQIGLSDFINSVQEIKKIFTDSNSFQNLAPSTKKIFLKDTSMMITSALPLINVRLEEAVKITNGWADITIANTLPRLNAIYSIESERSVLDVYLNNPAIQDTDMKNNTLNFENKTSSIDLFE